MLLKILLSEETTACWVECCAGTEGTTDVDKTLSSCWSDHFSELGCMSPQHLLMNERILGGLERK